MPRTFTGFTGLPAALLLGLGFADALLMALGVKKDIWFKDVIVGKFSVAYPAEGQGSTVTGRPGDNGPGAVMILGTRSNSALGMFEPGVYCLRLFHGHLESFRWVDNFARFQRDRRPLPRYGQRARGHTRDQWL